MKYGRHDLTQALDDHGSLKTISVHYREGKMTGSTKEYYEIRHKVNNDLEIMAQFNAFHREFTADPTMLDPFFKVEGRTSQDGKMYTVNCFTRVMK